MTEFTAEERDTIRSAGLAAMLLVSKADPGFLSSFKESMAGAKVLAKAPTEIRDLFTGFAAPPMAGKDEIDDRLVSEISEAAHLLRDRAPAQFEGFRDTILAACDAVAQAHQSVAPSEQQAIETVRRALTDTASSPQSPTG